MSNVENQPNPTASPAGPDVPETPRPITPRVARRAWIEPHVRFWWLAGALITVAAIGIFLGGLAEWRSENRVVREGVAVQAIAFDMSGGNKVKNRPLPFTSPVQLEYEYQGQKYTVTGTLASFGVNYVSSVPFEIRIDPESPRNWTNRVTPVPFVGAVLGAGIALVAGVGCVLVSVALRWQTLQLWKNGDLKSMRVVDHRNVAIAPRSVLLRCAPRLGKQDRLVTVYIPEGPDVPAVGEMVPLVTNATFSAGLAVANYHP
jgi:hypothetical protein